MARKRAAEEEMLWCAPCRDVVAQTLTWQKKRSTQFYRCAQGHISEVSTREFPMSEGRQVKVDLPSADDLRRIKRHGHRPHHFLTYGAGNA